MFFKELPVFWGTRIWISGSIMAYFSQDLDRFQSFFIAEFLWVLKKKKKNSPGLGEKHFCFRGRTSYIICGANSKMEMYLLLKTCSKNDEEFHDGNSRAWHQVWSPSLEASPVHWLEAQALVSSKTGFNSGWENPHKLHKFSEPHFAPLQKGKMEVR